MAVIILMKNLVTGIATYRIRTSRKLVNQRDKRSKSGARGRGVFSFLSWRRFVGDRSVCFM